MKQSVCRCGLPFTEETELYLVCPDGHARCKVQKGQRYDSDGFNVGGSAMRWW